MTNDFEAHNETRRGYTIRIIQDSDSGHLFSDDDGQPDIVTFLRSYDFTTRREDQGTDPESFLAKAKAGGYFVRPLRAYIHSGIAFSLTADSYPFNDRFDSGFAGFIFWTPEKREALGLTDSYIESILHEGETLESWLAESLQKAVETLNDIERGNVWGYDVQDPSGEFSESCWGFVGDYDDDGGPLEQAREIADSLADTETEKRAAELKTKSEAFAALVKAINAAPLDSDKAIIQAAGEKVESLREECRALESRLAELKEQPENENQD